MCSLPMQEVTRLVRERPRSEVLHERFVSNDFRFNNTVVYSQEYRHTHPSIDVFSKTSVVGRFRGKRANNVVVGSKMAADVS